MVTKRHSYPSILSKFSDLTALVVGDFMLDRFVYGAVKRVSPEAPIPILNFNGDEVMLGGAANVVSNVAALGANVIPISVIGTDDAGTQLRTLLRLANVDQSHLISSAARSTTRKTRFVAQQQLFRFDEEVIQVLNDEDRKALVKAFSTAVDSADIVILSDYGKGVLSDGVAAMLIDICKTAAIPVIVDPKGADYTIYTGATAVTPNRLELRVATGLPTSSDDEIVAAARLLCQQCSFDFVVATRSEEGMSIVDSDTSVHVPTTAREVFDVSGAGDTVIAAFSLAFAAEGEREVATEIANVAAGIVVGKRGTAQTSRDELLSNLTFGWRDHAREVLDTTAAANLSAAWKHEGLSVGFTNGCFDILHVGHASQLADARSHCDRLIVGLNTDASVRRNKGPTRPINSELDRAAMLLALKAVDAVVLFDEDTPLNVISSVLPDVLVKGGDYTIDTVVGADVVLSNGGRVHISPTVDGYSTTATLRKMSSSSPEKRNAQ